MGTILYSEGLDTCPEAYNLTHPEKVESIHRSYIGRCRYYPDQHVWC